MLLNVGEIREQPRDDAVGYISESAERCGCDACF